MAYGNWGAFVYKNGERQTNREDNTPYKEDEMQSGYYQAFARGADNRLDPHHASLGSGPFRICAYKSSPIIYWQGESVDDKPYQLGENAGTDDFWFFKSEGLKGELNGYKFTATPCEDPEAVEIELIEPDGTKWETKSGYCIGAGHED